MLFMSRDLSPLLNKADERTLHCSYLTQSTINHCSMRSIPKLQCLNRRIYCRKRPWPLIPLSALGVSPLTSTLIPTVSHWDPSLIAKLGLCFFLSLVVSATCCISSSCVINNLGEFCFRRVSPTASGVSREEELGNWQLGFQG